MQFIVFLHVLSAIIWIGGMIVIRFAIHYSMQNIKDPKIKIGKTLENLKRFFNLVIPSIITLLITAILMLMEFNFNETELNSIAITKEVIWTIMTIIFIFIFIKRNKAQQFFNSGDFANAKNNLLPIATYLIPINIILGLVAIFLGIVLRGL